MRTILVLASLLASSCGAPSNTNDDGPLGGQDSGPPPDLATSGCQPACMGATSFCNATRHCVSCLADGDCPKGTWCKVVSDAVANCQPGCMSDDRCAVGEKCCDGRCVDPNTSVQHCGGCGMACGAAHSSADCAAGKCAPGKCDPGWGDCDADAANGCEANLHADANNCTACGTACNIPHAYAGCADGCYTAACAYGFEDCNQNALDGCEAPLLADPKNCGGCGMACPNAANASIGCQNGSCYVTMCTPGYADCDQNLQTGCEIRIDNDVKNCGGCGKACGQGQICSGGTCTCPPCSFPNANAGCVNFNCAILSCIQGYDNCDGMNANGCETKIATDVLNCGACGNVCGNGLVCVNSSCTCAQCNIPHAKSICVNNMCQFDSCLPGFANCDNDPANGCEVDLNGDVNNCGACNMPCPMGMACAGGQCTTCGNQLIDSGSILCVPPGMTYTLAGDKCYTSQVIVNGTLAVKAWDGQAGGSIVLRAPAITVGVNGKINGDSAGQAGGAPAPAQGGFQGAGAGPGCGGGPGNAVGQGGSGGGYGGAGGHAKQYSNVGVCDRCNNPTVAHCWGNAGAATGTQGGPDLDMGSGGGAGGNSSGCMVSGGRGGRGGASVLLLGKTVTIDGAVSASGEQPPKDMSCGYHPGGGGGSGGAVVVRAETLSGAGSLTANGGRGGDTDGMNGDWGWSGGGGGGGRVKVFATNDGFNGMLNVNAGTGGASCNGGSCSVGLPGTAGTTSRSQVIPAMWNAINCGGL
jgi:hypothetical protein